MKNLVPKPLSRVANRSLLKLSASSPTILVVGGVIGLSVTVVMAAKATRKIDPIIEAHHKERAEIGYVSKTDKTLRRHQQTEILEMYYNTSLSLARLYGPTVAVGTISAASILSGHKILRGRHIATMAAYSGLQDQFLSYRDRVSKTLGEKAELDIYNGAHGEWVEDSDHKGEYKLEPVFDSSGENSYLRPWWDSSNDNWREDSASNYLFLQSVQSHMNNILQLRGHLFLSEVMDALRMERTPESIVNGWVWRPNSKGLDSKTGLFHDSFVDFGFMTSSDPAAVAFCKGESPIVQLNFNVDGIIYELI